MNWVKELIFATDVSGVILEQIGVQPDAFRKWLSTAPFREHGRALPTCLHDFVSARFDDVYGTPDPTGAISKEEFVDLGLMPASAEKAAEVAHLEIDDHEGPAYNVYMLALGPLWSNLKAASCGRS